MLPLHLPITRTPKRRQKCLKRKKVAVSNPPSAASQQAIHEQAINWKQTYHTKRLPKNTSPVQKFLPPLFFFSSPTESKKSAKNKTLQPPPTAGTAVLHFPSPPTGKMPALRSSPKRAEFRRECRASFRKIAGLLRNFHLLGGRFSVQSETDAGTARHARHVAQGFGRSL